MILAGNPVETNIKSRHWCLTKSDTKIYCFKLHSLFSLLPQIWNQTCSGQGKWNDQTQWYRNYIAGCMKSRNLNNKFLDSIVCCLNDSSSMQSLHLQFVIVLGLSLFFKMISLIMWLSNFLCKVWNWIPSTSETLQINKTLNENNQINLYVIDRLNAYDWYFIQGVFFNWASPEFESEVLAGR